MGKPSEAKIIANALKFLAAGFDMMATAGVPAVMRTLRSVEGADPVCEDETSVNAFCNVELLELGRFSASLPHDFLVQSIRSGANHAILEGDAAKGSASFGGPPQDGSESYLVGRIELFYKEVSPERFAMVVDIKLGEPIRSSFVYHGPVDQSDLIYQARFEVEFKDIFEFVAPTTKPHAETIVAVLAERFGMHVDMPPFYVSEPKDG